MTSDTHFQAMDRSQSRRRVVFNPEINLGHILQVIAFLAAAFVAYGALDKRVTITEVQMTTAAERYNELKSDIRDVQRSINELNRQLAVNSTPKK